MNKEKYLKNERGSITVFVLLSILFFLVITISVAAYTKNKELAVEEQYQKIKDNYEEYVGKEKEVYNSRGIEIGDYVNYTCDSVGSYSIQSAVSGYSSNQAIAQERNLKWKVLSKNDDGSINIISEKPTNTSVHLYGALGYNNGVYILNELCSKLYSNSSLGLTARSINIEDIENSMNNEGIEARNNYTFNGTQYNSIVTYSKQLYYPSLFQHEIGSGIDTFDINQEGTKQSETYNQYAQGITSETYLIAEKGLAATQTYYNLSMTKAYSKNDNQFNELFETGASYWIASRYRACDTINNSTQVNFGMRTLESNIIRGRDLFRSYNSEVDLSYKIRPVITISSGIELEYNSDNGAWDIVK